VTSEVSTEIKTVKVTPAQASFLEIEIIERYIDDEDDDKRSVCWVLLDSLTKSKGRSVDIEDRATMREMLLDAINFIDDEIEAHKAGDRRALGRIGGVDTAQEARILHRSGAAILDKPR